MVGQCGLNGKGAKHSIAAALLAVLICGPIARPAYAESLYQAFSQAYASNPVIGAQRAAVKVGEQDKAISSTGFAPALSGNADYSYKDQRGSAPANPKSDQTSHPRGFGVSLSQNIWNGFRTINSVSRDDASLQAARDDLRNVEQTILVAVATAYADVQRDRAIVELRGKDSDVLAARARQTRYQFEIGAQTLTDVDQSMAALARSRADLTIARATLDASMAIYRARVGKDPGKLEPATVPLKLVPHDLASALLIAQTDHPAIHEAQNAVRAAEINVDVERAGFAPSLDLSASADRRWDPDYFPSKTLLNDYSVVGRLTVPLYDKGLTFASVHRASELVGQRMQQLDNQRAEVRAGLVEAWGLFDASRIVIASADAQIAANDRALIGVQLEATAGQRTTLDILNAQRALLDAQVNREIAQHDRIISGYKLLAAIGHLSIDVLSPANTRGATAAAPILGFKLRPSSVEPILSESVVLRPGL